MTRYRLLKMNLKRDVKVREKQLQINGYLATMGKFFIFDPSLI